MRIGIINTQAPFITGGAERHAANLCRAFRERGFDATEISLPFKWYPARTLVDHILAAKLLDLGEVEGKPVDLAIGLKFPAYLAKHPNKTFWLLHQHRQAYDLWQSDLADLHHDPDGMAVRALIHEEDRRALGAPGATVYTNSRNVSDRLSRHLGLPSNPLYHPPPQAAMMRQGEYGDFLFAPSRMNGAKRQMLMLDALARSKTKARIVFAGPADNEDFATAFRARARELGVADRVTALGAVDDETMLRCYAECRGVVFVPVDEDYGYITLEAMLSGKPVITATDSGGSLEFVDDGVEGLVVTPEAGALGAAFDRLTDDAALAERMGLAGLTRYQSMGIGWDKVVATLTDGAVSGSDPLGADPAALLRHPNRGLGGDVAASASVLAPEKTVEPVLPMPSAPVVELEEETAPPAIDMEAFEVAIASPSGLEELPFDGFDDLEAAYDFVTCRADWTADTEADWQLCRAVLSLALEDRTDRVLEIGARPPFALQATLTALRPDTRVDGIWSDPRPLSRTLKSRRDGVPDLPVSLKSVAIERETLPVENATHDLVLGMDVLGHLAADPLFFLAEAARVLRPGGRIVLAVPNAASHRALCRVLDGTAPSPEPFAPTKGLAARAYAPSEVSRLSEAAGFVTETLRTADFTGEPIDPEIAALLAPRGSFALRGETVLYVGRLEAHAPVRIPDGLYDGDPRQLSGHLRLGHRDPLTGSAQLVVENRSKAMWYAQGQDSVGLVLDWADARGTLVHIGLRRDLPAALDAGGTVGITLPLDPGAPDASKGTVTVSLLQYGAGRMDRTGQANTLILPCSEAAFLRIARGAA